MGAHKQQEPMEFVMTDHDRLRAYYLADKVLYAYQFDGKRDFELYECTDDGEPLSKTSNRPVKALPDDFEVFALWAQRADVLPRGKNLEISDFIQNVPLEISQPADFCIERANPGQNDVMRNFSGRYTIAEVESCLSDMRAVQSALNIATSRVQGDHGQVGTNNIEAQEWAKKVLRRYAGSERVSELFAEDDQFANALQDLVGRDFEYSGFAGLTVEQAIEKAESMEIGPAMVAKGRPQEADNSSPSPM